eukprot:TRINITY_DN1572_c0_g2_i1.p1 TRINITY_DN1572_c0_g2~~TRINITY_DN1572_c0_g2_i1.p1  ORF type:complete len:207 (+),score=40.63 TRINITY_DN1572_c0_g2_i1:43-663(+)
MRCTVALLVALQCCRSGADFAPVWPAKFLANFTEDTWFEGSHQQNAGWVAYDWNSTAEVIYRPNGKLNPICNMVKKGDTSPCIHHSVSPMERYIIYPTEQFCCIFCKQYCGALSPSWVTAVPYKYAGLREIGGATCNEFLIESNTPDRVAFKNGTGELCELYDGGADFTGDNPFQWTVVQSAYTTTFDSAVLKLPSYCEGVGSCSA